MLKRQHIKFNKLKSPLKVGNKDFNEHNSIVIPTNQPNYKIVQAMFDQRTSFADSLFYDISAWTLPMAFDIDYQYITNTSSVGDEITEPTFTEGKVEASSNYAYLFTWDDYYSPKALYNLLSKGIRAKVAMKPFSLEGKSYDYGTIMIPVENQSLNGAALFSLLKEISKESGVDIDAVSTGLTQGIDLGSSNFETLSNANVAVIVGDGITSYDAGEIWHLLDTRYNMPVTKLDTRNLSRANLDKYSAIILPNAFGNGLNGFQEKLKLYVQNGGILIGYRNSVSWLSSNNFIKLDLKKVKPNTTDVPFDKREELRGAQVVGGAIFEAKIDRSHPVNFGYHDDKIALFRNTTVFIKPDSISNYKNAIQYTKNPLLSGYISKENLKAISETLPFKSSNLGRGKVIVFTDNTNFRAFWYGTNKLLANAIFFGKFM
jgi:hypothetical protein